MTINKLFDFYNLCRLSGFVRLLHDEKSNGSLALFAPTNDGIGNTNIYQFSEEDYDFYNLIKKTCWISNKDSSKIVNIIGDFTAKITKKYPKDEVTFLVIFKKNGKATIQSFASGKKKEKIKFKLFTVNNNVE